MYSVIMAGGKGARFWPRSREKKPKHLLDIVSEKTIIRETVDRIASLIPASNILVVTGKKHSRSLIKQLPDIPAGNVIIEPEGKNTAACIGLAALHIQKKAGDEVMVVLPADHAIHDEKEFLKVLSAAALSAVKGGLVTVGIKPSGVETGFGYIERGDWVEHADHQNVFRVTSIREKPDYQKAKEFVESGKFFWNSGMFVWKASVILNEIGRLMPDLHAGLMKINEVLGSPQEAAVLKRVYGKFASVSIDYGVMEKADNVLMLEGDFGWSDVGSWDALWEISPKDPKGNAAVNSGMTIFEDSENSLVYNPRKLTALVGVRDLIIVETGDALLVCRKGRSQDVKKIVEKLEADKLKKFL